MTTIRPATADDITRIVELYDEQLTISAAEAEKHRDTSQDNYLQVFNEINALPGCELFVAEENDEVIGSIVLMIVPNLSHKAMPWAIIENVIVNEKYRRQGIGELMMEHCKNRAKDAGCYVIQLMSNKVRKEAHQFYESLGYKASAEGFRLYL